jgi:hypothetical protein
VEERLLVMSESSPRYVRHPAPPVASMSHSVQRTADLPASSPGLRLASASGLRLRRRASVVGRTADAIDASAAARSPASAVGRARAVVDLRAAGFS